MAVVILIVNYWVRPLMPHIPIVINIIPQWYFPHSCQDRHFTQWGRVNPNNKIEILSLWFQKRTNVSYWSNSLSSDWDSKILNQNLTKTQYTVYYIPAFFVRFPGFISDISAVSTNMKSFFQSHFEKHYFETEMSENDLEPEKSNESVESLI